MQVEFEDQKWRAPATYRRPTEKGIVGLLIKWGLAKNATQANLIMIGLIVVLCCISYFSLTSINHNPTPPPVSANPTSVPK